MPKKLETGRSQFSSLLLLGWGWEQELNITSQQELLLKQQAHIPKLKHWVLRPKGDIMKIIDQSYAILSIPDNINNRLEVAGRTCYQSQDKIGCRKSNDQECPWGIDSHDLCRKMNCPQSICKFHSSHAFASMLLRRGHHAMIEFADIVVKFITNRGVTHELVRHRMGISFAQESTRYVKYDGLMEFIRPAWCSKKILGEYDKDRIHKLCQAALLPDAQMAENIFLKSCLKEEMAYKALLKHKWKAQQAREILPNALKTEIVAKANIREWRHILKLRTSPAAHPQMQALMTDLHDELKEKEPVLFTDL